MTVDISSPMASRGPTHTEHWRHECEVRYIISMPGREQRAGYVDAVAKRRGQPAAERLRASVRQLWSSSSHHCATPSPQGGAAAGHDGASSPLGELHHIGAPVEGSSLDLPPAGHSNPVECVVSGVAAQ